MKIFSTIKPLSFLNHPQEDYLLFSKKYPIFTVADGVSLVPKEGEKYPEKSGAGNVAEIFCQTAIFEAEKRYGSFKIKDLKEIFKTANKAVADYNLSQGRTKETINYVDFDLFSATTAFLLVKDKKAYWFSLCDSGVILLSKFGERIFSSPSCPPTAGKFLPKSWSKMKADDRARIMHAYRNKLGGNGELLGYGVADGQEGASNYLNFGAISFSRGEVAMLYTDGFENYLKLDEFNKIFIDWPENLEQGLNALMERKISHSKTKFGLERSLIAFSAAD